MKTFTTLPAFLLSATCGTATDGFSTRTAWPANGSRDVAPRRVPFSFTEEFFPRFSSVCKQSGQI